MKKKTQHVLQLLKGTLHNSAQRHPLIIPLGIDLCAGPQPQSASHLRNWRPLTPLCCESNIHKPVGVSYVMRFGVGVLGFPVSACRVIALFRAGSFFWGGGGSG